MSENDQHIFTILKDLEANKTEPQLTKLFEDCLKGLINPLKRRE